MKVFKNKIKPAESYTDFESCCDSFNKYKFLFSINTHTRTVAIKNSNREPCSDEPMYVNISRCPFCGEPFESE